MPLLPCSELADKDVRFIKLALAASGAIMVKDRQPDWPEWHQSPNTRITVVPDVKHAE